MEAMREKWTDGRLDDMNTRIDAGFDRLDRDIRDVRAEVHDLRTEMNSRFEATNRLIVQVGGGMVVTMVAGSLGVIAQG
jgi:hypothetical protein